MVEGLKTNPSAFFYLGTRKSSLLCFREPEYLETHSVGAQSVNRARCRSIAQQLGTDPEQPGKKAFMFWLRGMV